MMNSDELTYFRYSILDGIMARHPNYTTEMAIKEADKILNYVAGEARQQQGD